MASAAEPDAVKFVHPLLGTQKSQIGYGGTMPFVTPPFGMTDWTAQTRQNKISITSYNYDDTTISGFIATHQPAIWMGDYGYVTLMPQVGSVRTTPAQARKIWKREMPAWNFDQVRQQLRSAWNQKLNRLQVDGASDREKIRLYTALYHALLYPHVFYEDGRYYSAFDNTIHTGESYTAYSIWDTFRAENSLLTLLAPERIDGMITALLRTSKRVDGCRSGRIPATQTS